MSEEEEEEEGYKGAQPKKATSAYLYFNNMMAKELRDEGMEQ